MLCLLDFFLRMTFVLLEYNSGNKNNNFSAECVVSTKKKQQHRLLSGMINHFVMI